MASTPLTPVPDRAPSVVLVEDDADLNQSLVKTLELAGFEVIPFASAEAALARLEAGDVDAVLADLYLDGMTGIELLAHIHARDAELPFIVMTAQSDIATALRAIREGAYDFIGKPFERQYVTTLLRRAVAQRRLALENRALRECIASTTGLSSILRGVSPAMQKLRDLVLRLAASRADTVVLGETGTGKELVARCVHEFSGVRGRLVVLNCPAIPDQVFESELFGHEPGAFTGAGKARAGKVEQADGGTLFLDEIDAMPLHLQAKLLRVLQDRTVSRLGSNDRIPVNFRVVAATKVDLKAYSDAGKFRLDLYYRLNVLPLTIAPLRERHEDIATLFTHYVDDAATRFGHEPRAPSVEVMQQLAAYRWPGNVRELKGVAQRFQLGLPLGLEGAQPREALQRASLEELLATVEREMLDAALRRHRGSVSAVCEELGITQATLYRKLGTHSMKLGDFRGDSSV
ncbi:response regulator [Paraburkholderia madseniana]|uniref:Response regulator n=2 Tax=Paraburkholderia madseniana TaxID=2599607 RepID=A0A6N6VYB7_9BURK|nr:response regulator [Paraburkholderia madseniana]